jgi:SAM-dependent methyltransferase
MSKSNLDPVNSAAKFYDTKIAQRNSNNVPLNAIGSLALPSHIRAPYAYAEKVIAQHKLSQPNVSSALDLGCGVGIHSLFLIKYFKNTTGVDVSRKSIESAQALAALNSISDCRWVLADASQFLQNDMNTYDIICCYGSLYYMKTDQILPLINKKLSHNGIFISVETNGDNFITNLYRKIRYGKTQKRDDQSFNHLMRNADFNKFSQYFINCERHYFDCLTLLAPIFNFSPLLKSFYLKLAQPIDKWLLNFNGLHFLAFKVVSIGHKQP